MAKKSLRAQLNQIRAWVRQGRTDAWIAHQLEVPASELREFRRRHELTAGDEGDDGELDLRDEIEAEIEAASLDEESDEEEDTDDEADETDDSGDAEKDDGDDEKPDEGDGEPQAEAPRRRRRRGRRGRGGGGGGGRQGSARKLEATFDHGEEGYGLWLDPAVTDDSTYSEHWAGHRAVEVEIEPDRITIRRAS